MKKHVTVVPSDRLIIVEGEALQFDFAAPENLHAVQWHNGEGHMEFLDDMNHPLTEGDYAEDVAPFVTAWEREKARLEDEAAAAEAARVAAYNAPGSPRRPASERNAIAVLKKARGSSSGTVTSSTMEKRRPLPMRAIMSGWHTAKPCAIFPPSRDSRGRAKATPHVRGLLNLPFRSRRREEELMQRERPLVANFWGCCNGVPPDCTLDQ